MSKLFKTNIDLCAVAEPGTPEQGDVRVSANASGNVVLTKSDGTAEYVLDSALLPLGTDMGGTGLAHLGAPGQVLTVEQDAKSTRWQDPPQETPASIKEKYESNQDTNAYTDGEKATLGTVGNALDLVTSAKNSLVAAINEAVAMFSAYVPTMRTINGHQLDVDVTLTSADIGSEQQITPGTTDQYLRGDKSWQDLADATRHTPLTGLPTYAAEHIAPEDTTLSAFAKLQAQITAINPPLPNPMTTAGDIIVADAGGSPTRLPMGAAGQVLTATGSTLAWLTGSAASSDYVKLAHTDVTTPSIYVSFNSIFNGSLYAGYVVYFSDLTPAPNDARLCVQFKVGTSGKSGNSDYTTFCSAAHSTAYESESAVLNRMILTQDMLASPTTLSAATGLSGQLFIAGTNSSATKARLLGSAAGYSVAGGAATLFSFAAELNNAYAIDGFRFVFETGNIASGSVSVFGIKK